MPSLLDMFGGQDPQNLGLLSAAGAMLNASGPSLMPRSTGQVLAAGLGGYQQGQQQAIEQQMIKQRMELFKLQELREQQKMAMQQKALKAFGVDIGASSAPASGGNAPYSHAEGQAAYDAAGAAGIDNPTPGQLNQFMANGRAPTAGELPRGGEKSQLDALRAMAIAGVPGAKELFDIHKYQNEPQKLESGSIYRDRATGSERYIPKLDAGFTMDGSGNASMVPGYVEGVGSIEKAKSDAQEGAKARYGTTVLNLPGGPKMVSNADLPSVLSGGWDGVNQDYKAGQPARNKDQIATLQEEYRLATNPRDRDAIARELKRFGGTVPQGGPGLTLQDPVEQERQLQGVRTDAEVDKAGKLKTQGSEIDASKLYRQLKTVIPQARSLLQKGPTGSTAGSMVDSTLGFFGRATDSGVLADQLSTLGGWLTSNVPRMEGPQSDADRRTYSEMAGRVGDRSLPVRNRLAALDTLEELAGRYADANGGMPKGDAAPAQRKVVTLADIAETARKSGKSTAEVTAAARAKGYTIGGQ